MTSTETLFSIQDEINRGEFSFQQIADMFAVTLDDVDHIFMEMIDMERCLLYTSPSPRD